jgi:hypothetical protein
VLRAFSSGYPPHHPLTCTTRISAGALHPGQNKVLPATTYFFPQPPYLPLILAQPRFPDRRVLVHLPSTRAAVALAIASPSQPSAIRLNSHPLAHSPSLFSTPLFSNLKAPCLFFFFIFSPRIF